MALRIFLRRRWGGRRKHGIGVRVSASSQTFPTHQGRVEARPSRGTLQGEGRASARPMQRPRPGKPIPSHHHLQLLKILTIPSIFPHIHLHENHPPRAGRAVPNADQIRSAHPWHNPARSPFSSDCGAKHGARGGRRLGDFSGRGFALPKTSLPSVWPAFFGGEVFSNKRSIQNSPCLRASFPFGFGAAGPCARVAPEKPPNTAPPPCPALCREGTRDARKRPPPPSGPAARLLERARGWARQGSVFQGGIDACKTRVFPCVFRNLTA